jgi:hypothetical protein
MEDEMGRACGMHGEECIHYFGGRTTRKETIRKTEM